MAWTRFTPTFLPPADALEGSGGAGQRRESWNMTATRIAPREARKAILEYAKLVDLTDTVLDDVLLCVSEAVSNVVFHAYRDVDSEDTVEIEASVDNDLRVCVRDRGSGFAVRSTSPGLGLGLPIITKLTRTFHIRTMSDGGGTEVVMRFSLA